MIKSQKKTSNDKNKYKRIEVKKNILKCFIVYINSKTLCNVKKKRYSSDDSIFKEARKIQESGY
jgi:hypothetical protein